MSEIVNALPLALRLADSEGGETLDEGSVASAGNEEEEEDEDEEEEGDFVLAVDASPPKSIVSKVPAPPPTPTPTPPPHHFRHLLFDVHV